MANENIDFVTDTILNSESPFVLVWPVKNCRAKEFASYFKTRDCYTHTEPVEKIVGCNYETGKPHYKNQH